MGSLNDFYKLSSADEFFEFFDIAYDKKIVAAKRLHILKFFGQMVKKIGESGERDEERLLNFYKFALLSVYKSYENGFNPSAAEVWNMFDNPPACLSCSTTQTCQPIGVEDGKTVACRS